MFSKTAEREKTQSNPNNRLCADADATAVLSLDDTTSSFVGLWYLRTPPTFLPSWAVRPPTDSALFGSLSAVTVVPWDVAGYTRDLATEAIP